MKYIIFEIAVWILSPFYLTLALLVSIFVRFQKRTKDSKPRFVWGPSPIVSNIYGSRAIRQAGYSSETFVNGFYPIHKRSDWDIVIQEKYKFIPIVQFRFFPAFLEALFKYDVFVINFGGFFLGSTPLRSFEALFLKIAKKKTILIPIGGDSYVYRNIRSTSVIHGLMMSYAYVSKEQESIFRQVAYWCKNGDVVMPGFMGPDGFGRWDVLMPTMWCIDLVEWTASKRMSLADGVSDTVYIAHASNHRGFKGTEFIVEAVKKLQEEGLKVELIVLEKIENSEVKRILREDTDILAEQIIYTGNGFNGLEGMASGLPTICNLESEDYTLPFRRWSFLDECPVVSGSPETLVDVLRKLITRPELRHQLGNAGREYAEKYLGFESAQYLFGEMVEYLYGRRDSLINLYHPLLGEYPKRKPRVRHPLVKNQIVD
jgi:hypothetical protein